MSNAKHTSDCALHNGPAYAVGPCDCGAETLDVLADVLAAWDRLYGALPANATPATAEDDEFGAMNQARYLVNKLEQHRARTITHTQQGREQTVAKAEGK